MVEGARRFDILRAARCIVRADLTIAQADKPLLALEACVGSHRSSR